MASKSSKCNNVDCQNDGKLNCSRCKGVKYCSQQCQKKDWNIHKLSCVETNEPQNEKLFLNLTTCGDGDCCNSGSKRCSQCKNVWYCSVECQKKHWKEHKNMCKQMVEQPDSDGKKSGVSCGKPKCPNEGTKQCTRCRDMFYCSKECQKDDWSVHKATCRQEGAKNHGPYDTGGSSGNNNSSAKFDYWMRNNPNAQHFFQQMSGKFLGKTTSVAKEYLRAYTGEFDHAKRIEEEESIYRSQMLSAKLSGVTLYDEDFTAAENFMKRWGSCLLDRDHLFNFLRTSGRKFGDIYERSIYSSYSNSFFQTMRNTSITDQIYELGQTYIGFGFVDLFQLLWGSFLNESLVSSPLNYYGFDMSRVVTLRSKLIYGAMKNFKEHEISTNSILQMWFSSCWDRETQHAFKMLLEDVLDDVRKYALDKKDLSLMNKWSKNEINVCKAKTEFAAGVENATFDDVWHMKSERDRVSFCRYIFTGIIFANENELVCGNPTMYTEFEGSTKLKGELFFKSIDLNLSNFEKEKWVTDLTPEKCLPDSLYNLIVSMTRKKAIELRDSLWQGKILCHFEAVFLDSENMEFAQRIKNLSPYGIDWSNIPDYMKKSSFIKFARACSTEKTVHQLHFINWCQYVYGSCHVDWALHQDKCKQMYHEWKSGMASTRKMLNSTSWRSKYIEGGEYINPLNDINIFLSAAFKQNFEDYFLSDESGKKLNRHKGFSCDGVANNFFSQSPTLFRAAFSFNDGLQLQTTLA